MVATMLLITTIISAVIVLVAVHVSITIVLPRLKDLLNPIIKDEKAMSGLMVLLIVLIALLALKAEIELVLSLQVNALNTVSALKPGIDLMLSLGKYLGYIVLGFIVVLGLKNYKQ